MAVSHSRPPRRVSESLGDLRRTQLTHRALGKGQPAGQPTCKLSNLQSKVLSIRAQESPSNQECPTPNRTPTQLSSSAPNLHHARRKVHQPSYSVSNGNHRPPNSVQHSNSPIPEQHSNSPTLEQRSNSPSPKQLSQQAKHSSDPVQPPQSSSNSPPTTGQNATISPPTATCQTASNRTRPSHQNPTSKPSSSPTSYPSC